MIKQKSPMHARKYRLNALISHQFIVRKLHCFYTLFGEGHTTIRKSLSSARETIRQDTLLLLSMVCSL
jgi:hypothetical protein